MQEKKREILRNSVYRVNPVKKKVVVGANLIYADVAELADAQDLGSCLEKGVSSTLTVRIVKVHI